jgi:hypothetical protein
VTLKCVVGTDRTGDSWVAGVRVGRVLVGATGSPWDGWRVWRSLALRVRVFGRRWGWHDYRVNH